VRDFLQIRRPSCQPTNSTRAPKGTSKVRLVHGQLM